MDSCEPRTTKDSKDERRRAEEPDAEDRFAASIVDDLRQLSHRENLMAKNEIHCVIFKYQIKMLDKSKEATIQTLTI